MLTDFFNLIPNNYIAADSFELYNDANKERRGGHFMKIDMHCHVKEGSPDSKIGIDEYITILKANGFGGMVVTDHDTYNGYRYWKETMKGRLHNDFVVLKGIEYDTVDAGHILVIMPQGVKMRLLELKGLPVAVLIDFVHRNGGILGPAHPCGEPYMSFTGAKSYYKNPEVMERFDFVEVFNACESAVSNDKALKLAQNHGKIGIAGSDAHNPIAAGMAYTNIPGYYKTETELITAFRKKQQFEVGGSFYNKTLKDRLGKINKIYSYSFWFYNTLGEVVKRRQRKLKSFLENPMTAIDPVEIDYLESYKKGTSYVDKKITKR